MSGNWRFAWRPFWLFSHLFAATVVVSFVLLGFWQLDRLDQRRAANVLIEARTAVSLDIAEALSLLVAGEKSPETLDYQAVSGVVRVVDPDIVRIANRTLNGSAGEHSVAVVELDDGSVLALNRGFIPSGFRLEPDVLPSEPFEISGWLRATVEREGFGAVDVGEGRLLPRLETAKVADRFGETLPDVWLQLEPGAVEPGESGAPQAIDLPVLNDGPHFGYAMQWFIFATLGVIFYAMLLSRQARGHVATTTM